MTLREYIRSKAFPMGGVPSSLSPLVLTIDEVDDLVLAVRRQALEEAAGLVGKFVELYGLGEYLRLSTPPNDDRAITHPIWVDKVPNIHDSIRHIVEGAIALAEILQPDIAAIPCTLDGPAPEVE